MEVESQKQSFSENAAPQQLLEELYRQYMHDHPGDLPEVQAQWEILTPILQTLPEETADTIWQCICDIGLLQERFAFLKGIQTGIEISKT